MDSTANYTAVASETHNDHGPDENALSVPGLMAASTPRNDRSVWRAEPAAPRRSDLPGPGVDFLERVGADLLVVHGPGGTRRPADGPARCPVQGQVRRSWWPLAVQDVPVWMISKPGDVAVVVVHELDDHVHDCCTGGPGTRRTPRWPSTCGDSSKRRGIVFHRSVARRRAATHPPRRRFGTTPRVHPQGRLWLDRPPAQRGRHPDGPRRCAVAPVDGSGSCAGARDLTAALPRSLVSAASAMSGT